VVRAAVAGCLIMALVGSSGRAAAAQGTPRLAIDLPARPDPAAVTDPQAAGQPGASAPHAHGPAVRALDILLDGQTRDLLRNGFPARLHFRVELWHAGGLFNALDGTREWDIIARYDPLEKQYRAARLADDNVTVLGEFPQFPALAAALGAPYEVPLVPGRGGGRYYYNAVVDVEMLSLSDLDEVERWLRGELRPAVRGQRNPGGVLGRGLRTLFVRLLGAERRHYEVRSKTFKAG
jgi:hypothetical protein